MKECAICSKDIEKEKEPALLFIGKYTHRYEICADCERIMDSFVSAQDRAEKKRAADTIYNHLFHKDAPQKPKELIDYFTSLFQEDSDAAKEAAENLQEYREENESDEASANDAGKAEEALPTEEEFFAGEKKKTSLAVKLLFLVLFLLLGGGAIALGIIRSSVITIVVGAIVVLLGIVSVFAKD